MRKLLLTICLLLPLLAMQGKAQPREVREVVEHYKNMYYQEDLAGLDSIFLGENFYVNDSICQGGNGFYVTHRKGKGEMSQRLHELMGKNSNVEVTFDEEQIKPHIIKADWWGVTIHQTWRTKEETVSGTLFMLIEQRADRALVHIYVWQPDKIKGMTFPNDPWSFMEDFFLP